MLLIDGFELLVEFDKMHVFYLELFVLVGFSRLLLSEFGSIDVMGLYLLLQFIIDLERGVEF